MAAADDCGVCSVDFLTRVIEEVEQRAITLATLHRRQVAETLRNLLAGFP